MKNSLTHPENVRAESGKLKNKPEKMLKISEKLKKEKFKWKQELRLWRSSWKMRIL